MDENKFEKIVPETEDAVLEEVSDEESVAPEETNEELVDVEVIDEEDADVQVNDMASDEVVEELIEELIEEEPVKKKKTKVILTVILAIVLVVALLFGMVYAIFGTDLYNKFGLNKSEYGSFPDLMRNTVVELTEKKSENKYNNLGYANPSGKTVQDIIDQFGISLDEFLEMYGLPEDMPADTEEMAAFYSMPVKVYVQMIGADFATFKEIIEIPDETTPPVSTTIGDKIKAKLGKFEPQKIDENTPWGIVEDEIKLGKYVGEENLEGFKKQYDIPFDVNADTKYKEVRRFIEEKQMQQVADEKNTEESEKEE